MGLTHGWGRSRRKPYGNPLQYPCLENPIDRGAWRVIVHGVEKNQTRLSDWVLTRQVPYSTEYPERESFHRADLTLNTGKVPLRFPELFQPSWPSVTRSTSLPIFFFFFNRHSIYVEYNIERWSKHYSFAGKTPKEKRVLPLLPLLLSPPATLNHDLFPKRHLLCLHRALIRALIKLTSTSRKTSCPGFPSSHLPFWT